MAKIKPYAPEPLPLKKLNWAKLVPHLGETHAALALFNHSLKSFSSEKLEHLRWEESIHSLRSQGIRTRLKEMLQYIQTQSVKETRAPLLQKVMNAQEGLEFAIGWAKRRPLSLSFLCHLHAIVKKDGPNPKEIGRIRERQNWIGAEGCTLEEAYFYPPKHTLLKKYLKELNRYSLKKEKDPLVQLAILFGQFLILSLIHI